MNFFQQLFEQSPNADLTLRIMAKGESVSVSVLPTTLENMTPLVITGSVEELDKGFFDAIRKPLQTATGLVSNAAEFEKEAAKAKPAAAKSNPTPAKTASEKKSKKSPTAKVEHAAKPEAEVKPEPAVPQPSPFPKESRVIYTSPGHERGRIGTVQSDVLDLDGKIQVLFDGYDKVATMDPSKLGEYKLPTQSEEESTQTAAPPKPAPPAPPMPPRPSAAAATDNLFTAAP